MSTLQTGTRVPYRVQARLLDEEGVRYGLAHAGLVATALLASATELPGPLSFTLLVATGLTLSRGLVVRWRVGVALAAWAIWTGFLENSLGVLSFSGPDVARLVAVGVIAGATGYLGRLRWVRLGG